jgi:hypothetical protein
MTKISYAGYRFPPEVIHQAIWLYLRFTLSFRGVEDLLAERGIVVSYETVRRWVNHFGPVIAAHLRKHRPKPLLGQASVENREELRSIAATSRSQWPPTHRFRTYFRRQEQNPNGPKIAQRWLEPFAGRLRP